MTEQEKVVDLEAWRNRYIANWIQSVFNQLPAAAIKRLMREAKKMDADAEIVGSNK